MYYPKPETPITITQVLTVDEYLVITENLYNLEYSLLETQANYIHHPAQACKQYAEHTVNCIMSLPAKDLLDYDLYSLVNENDKMYDNIIRKIHSINS